MVWSKPTSSGVVTSPFGPRTPPKLPGGGFGSSKHLGTDYRAAKGTNIFAVGDGTVVASKAAPGRGEYVQIDHGNGVRSIAQHLSTRLVQSGAKVTGGQLIGKAGATGAATGPHLHLEISVAGTNVDPVKYLSNKLSPTTPAPVAPVQPVNPVKPPEPAPAARRVMKRGDNGEDVEELQRVLNAWYPAQPGRPLLVEDGDYGTRTEIRVRYFQERARLVVDGEAGPATLGALGIK